MNREECSKCPLCQYPSGGSGTRNRMQKFTQWEYVCANKNHPYIKWIVRGNTARKMDYTWYKVQTNRIVIQCYYYDNKIMTGIGNETVYYIERNADKIEAKRLGDIMSHKEALDKISHLLLVE